MRNFLVFFHVLIVLALLTLAVSCGSSPPPAPAPVTPASPPPEPAPEPEPAPTPVVEEPPAGPTAEERYAEMLPRVEAARQTALDAGAEETNPDGLAQAEDSAAHGFETAENGDYEAALTRLEEAIALFEKAAQDAAAEWEKRVEEAKLAADKQKAAADEVKAGNAAKPEYAEADSAYQNAGQAQRAKDYREAITGYENAARQFAVAAQIAADKRDAAAAVLLAAEKKIAESDELAIEVEQALLNEGDD
jgi:colicin import membrane protein